LDFSKKKKINENKRMKEKIKITIIIIIIIIINQFIYTKKQEKQIICEKFYKNWKEVKENFSYEKYQKKKETKKLKEIYEKGKYQEIKELCKAINEDCCKKMYWKENIKLQKFLKLINNEFNNEKNLKLEKKIIIIGAGPSGFFFFNL
jgi:hypothetical protein